MLTCFSDALNKMEQASEVIIGYISLLWKKTTSIDFAFKGHLQVQKFYFKS